MSASLVRRVVTAVAVVLVVVLAASTVTAAIVIRRPLPTTSGETRIPGLGNDVDVVRDDLGIPQIYADDPHDLFFAQGYVHAQDRFFEMDYRRHVTSGRVAELVGDQEAAIQADSVIRTFGWRRVAEQEWDLLSQQTRDHLTAYADGVNAYLDRRTPSAAAIEYTVLGTQVSVEAIEPWDPIDSVAWLKAMAWDLRGNYDDELLRAAAYGSTQDTSLVGDLFPPYPAETNPPIITDGTPSSPPPTPARPTSTTPRCRRAARTRSRGSSRRSGQSRTCSARATASARTRGSSAASTPPRGIPSSRTTPTSGSRRRACGTRPASTAATSATSARSTSPGTRSRGSRA